MQRIKCCKTAVVSYILQTMADFADVSIISQFSDLLHDAAITTFLIKATLTLFLLDSYYYWKQIIFHCKRIYKIKIQSLAYKKQILNE